MIATTQHDGHVQRVTFGGLGVIASVVILAVSCLMNYRFGCWLGKSPLDCQIYGSAAVASDIAVAITPFFIAAAWRERKTAALVLAVLVWLVTTVFALTSAIGHAALNRLDTTGQRAYAATNYQDLRADLAEARKQLGHVPEHRPEATIRSDLEGWKANRFWVTTSECASPAGKVAREYCQAYWKLDAELGAARDATRLTDRVAQISAKLDKVSDGQQAAMLSEADPQASVLAKITRQDLGSVQAQLALLVVCLLVVGSGPLLYASTSYLPARKLPGYAAIDITPSVALASPAGSETLVETAVEAIAPPQPEPLPPDPPAKPARVPLPGSEARLKSIEFPLHEKLTGPLRPKHPPKEAARRFAFWLRCYGLHGTHLSDQVIELYREYVEADYREPTSAHLMLQCFAEVPGVEKQTPKVKGRSGATRYVVGPGKFPKTPKDGEEIEGKEEGRLLDFRPLAEAPADDVGAARKRRFVPDVDYSLQALRQLGAHIARRAGRQAHRKQRGSRINRTVRVA